VHVEASITVSTLSGTWHDSAGRSGTFAFTPGGRHGGQPAAGLRHDWRRGGEPGPGAAPGQRQLFVKAVHAKHRAKWVRGVWGAHRRWSDQRRRRPRANRRGLLRIGDAFAAQDREWRVPIQQRLRFGRGRWGGHQPDSYHWSGYAHDVVLGEIGFSRGEGHRHALGRHQHRSCERGPRLQHGRQRQSERRPRFGNDRHR
jgi:hypothetical protein